MKGDVAALVINEGRPLWLFEVSSLVIVKLDGTLPDPLCLRLFVVGPAIPVGEAGLDRFLDVRVEDVLGEIAEGTANGVLIGVMGKLGLKLCFKPFRSVVEKDCLNILVFDVEPPGSSAVVWKTPAPGT